MRGRLSVDGVGRNVERSRCSLLGAYSRAFAQRILTEGGKGTNDRLAWAFRVATSRRPASDEVKVLADVLKQQTAEYQKNTGAATRLLGVGGFQVKGSIDPVELAAWTTVASVVLNLDETVTKN